MSNHDKDLFGNPVYENDDHIVEVYYSQIKAERWACVVGGALLGAILTLVTKIIGVW